MRVLSVLNPSLKDYNISGAALQAINLGNELVKNGIDVDYIASDAICEFIGDKSSIYKVPDIGKRGVIKKALEYAVKIYKSGNYDIMHVNIHQMSVLDAIVNFIPDYINVVYTQHTSTILGRFSLGYRESARILSSSLSRKNCTMVMPSQYMVKVWEEYTGNKISDMDNVQVIYNGTRDYFNGKLKYDREDMYVTCGRIDPNKRIFELAEFCDRKKLPLTVVGSLGMGTLKISDSNMEYYRKFLDIVNNSKYIKHIQYMPNMEVVEIISKARGYITFSKQESFGLTVAEAMSVGTPVFYIEGDSAISEIYDSNETSNVIGDMKRKSLNKKHEMMYLAFQKLGFLDNPSISKINKIRERYESLNLSQSSCALSYIDLFKRKINNFV